MAGRIRSSSARGAVVAFAMLAVSCGGGGGPTLAPPAPTPIAIAIPGRAVVKAQGDGAGFTLLEEKALPLTQPGPDRRIALLDATGGEVGNYTAPADWALVDATRHPSGDTTAILATARSVKLVRLDRIGRVTGETALVGTLVSRVALAPGARQNQVRAIVVLGNRTLVAGMVNGPGTHSGDADPAAITADGLLRDVAIPSP